MADESFELGIEGDFLEDIQAAERAFVSFGGTVEDFKSKVEGLKRAKLDKYFKSLLKEAPDRQDVVTTSKWGEELKLGALELVGLGGIAGGVGAFVGQSLNAALQTTVDTAKELVTTFAGGLVSANTFGTATYNALRRFAGGDGDKAERQLAGIEDVAKKTGASLDLVSKAFLSIADIGTGLGDDFDKDLAALKVGADSLGKTSLATDLAKIAKAGPKAKIGVDTFNDAAKVLGLTREDLAKALEIGNLDKVLGDDVKSVRRLEKALNRIDGKGFAKAILEIGKQGGGLESIFSEQASPIEVLGNRLNTAFTKAFKDVDVKEVAETIGNFVEDLGPTFESVAGGVNKAFKAVNSFLTFIRSDADSAVKFREAISGIVAAAQPVSDALGKAFGGDDGKVSVEDFTKALTKAANAIAFFVKSTATQVAAVITVIDIVGQGQTALLSLGISGAEAGGNLISGFVKGILSGASSVISAVGSIAQQAIGTFKATLGIASPSKVFEGFGQFTAKGAEKGLELGAVGVAKAAAGVAEAPIAAFSDAGLTPGSAPAPTPLAVPSADSGGGGTTQIFQISVNGDLSEDQIEAAFRRVFLELGGDLNAAGA